MNYRTIGLSITALLILTLGFGLSERSVFSDDQPAPVTKEASAVNRRVVKKVLPAVVSIVSSKSETPASRWPVTQTTAWVA